MTNAKKYLKDGVNIKEFIDELHHFWWVNEYDVREGIRKFLNAEAAKEKPILTEDERIILKNIDRTYTHISRTYGDIWVGIGEETADSECKRVCVFNHLFQFIKERRRIFDKRIAEGVIGASKKRR